MLPSRSELLGIWQKRGKKNLFIALGVTGCLAIGALGSTLAANINLNGGETVEFGQGIAQTTACSGRDSILVTPYSEFVNEVGAGAHYFTSVTLSDIPSSCVGAVFTIRAYGESDVPLTLTNCSEDNPVLEVQFGGSGGSQQTALSYDLMYTEIINETSNSFTASWSNGGQCTSSALAEDVLTITIQSSGSPTGEAGYVADFTAGQTSFNSDPIVAFDANIWHPNPSVWSNGGSLQGDGDLSFSADPSVVTGSNAYVEIARGITTSGSVGTIAGSADRMSVEMWLNFNDDGGEFDSSLFSFDTSDDRGGIDGCGYNLSFNNGYLGINTCNSDTFGFNASSLNNGWHHIVWIASTSSRFTQKIFVDGTLRNLVSYNSGDSDLTENARPNIGNGGFGVNAWSADQGATYKVGALNIYAGEMPSGTIASRNSSYQERLNP